VTTIAKVVDYNDARIRRVTLAEARDAIDYLSRIVNDLEADRVPSSNHARSAASAIADVAHGVGVIATHAEIRKALTAEQES
jgi:hypothetical protein